MKQVAAGGGYVLKGCGVGCVLSLPRPAESDCTAHVRPSGPLAARPTPQKGGRLSPKRRSKERKKVANLQPFSINGEISSPKPNTNSNIRKR